MNHGFSSPVDENIVHRFFIAARDGDIPGLKFLLQAGVDPDVRRGNWTPLLASSWTNKTEAVKVLLKSDVNSNARGVHGYTPLHLAAEKGNEETAHILIEYGAKVYLCDNEGISAHDIAVRRRHYKIASMLREHGCTYILKEFDDSSQDQKQGLWEPILRWLGQ